MKRFVLVVVALGACSSKKKDQGKDQPVVQFPDKAKAKDPAPMPATACTIKLSLDIGKIEFDSGTGVTGKSSDLELLKPLAGKCSATIVATDDTRYDAVIHLMDQLTVYGITDIALDDGKPGKYPKTPPPLTGPNPWKMEVTPDGKIIGHRDPNVKADQAWPYPVIVMAKDKVSIAGKDLEGKPTDSGMDVTITKALPDHPKEPTVILQADQSLPYSAIKNAIAGANAAGYDNVLFAVKNSLSK